MSFFSKIIDMFMQPKELKKEKNNKRMNFDKFGSQFDDIKERAIVISKNLANDTKKKLYDKNVYPFLENELDLTEENQKMFLNQSNSMQYSTVMAQVMRFLRTYALYYLHADKGRTKKERLKMYDRLTEVYDLTIFSVLRYFNKEKQQLVVWHGETNKFYYQEDIDKEVITMAGNVLNANSDLIQAILKNDNTKVYDVFNKQLNTSKIRELEANEIFEL